MVRFSSRYAAPTAIRKNSPLNNDELMRIVPSAFSAEKHDSRSERYTYIPTITLLDKLREEGFEPFYASQSRVRDPERREFTKHMIRLRRGNKSSGEEVPEIVLLNSHDGSSSYKMIPGIFRQVCTNGLVCWKSFGEISVPHKGDIVSQVIEGAYEVLGVFDKVENNISMMKSIQVNSEERRLLGQLALEYKYDGKEPPVSAERIIKPRAWYDKGTDLWTAFNIVQENLIKGGSARQNGEGKKNHDPGSHRYRRRYKAESGAVEDGGGVRKTQIMKITPACRGYFLSGITSAAKKFSGAGVFLFCFAIAV